MRFQFRRLALIILCTCGSFIDSQAQRFHLFPQELRENGDPLILDFIERYAYRLDSLDRAGEFVPQFIADDGVIFSVGNFESFSKVRPEDTFSMNRMGDKYYEVSWTDTLGNPFLRFSFPISFELILGKPQVEIEQEMKEMLLRQPLHAEVAESPELYGQAADGCWQTTPSEHYYLNDLNTSCYYKYKGLLRKLVPIFDKEHTVYSAINLLQGVLPEMDTHMLYIDQSLYGFKTHSYYVQLSQWINYCREMNLTVYVGLQEERTDGVKLLLLAQSHDLGFDHMMSIVIPSDLTEDKNAVLKAKLHAFIPTHNVKSLYQEYDESE